MEKRILEKIKSNYIIKNIFDYISNDLIKYKLFIHSKKFKECLNIQLFDYQDKYFNKIKFNLKDYCEISNDIKDISNKQYNLKNKLNEFLSQNNLNFFDFQSYIIQYFLKNENDLKQKYSKIKNKIKIDIYSPIINILLNNPIFKDVFLISIPQRFIIYNNYEKDYVTFFDLLNKMNIEYGLIIEQFYNSNLFFFINYSCEVDFNQVKTIVIRENHGENKFYIQFFRKFFYFDIYNTLINLEIELSDDKFFSFERIGKRIDDNMFEKINELKVIEYLKLKCLDFYKNFILKLNHLKKLHIFSCENISLYGDYYNLKELYLEFVDMKKSNSLIKCPEIEIYKINYCDNSLLFDFESFIKLKKLNCHLRDILYLKNTSLKSIHIKSDFSDIDTDMEMKVLEKLISINYIRRN